VAQRFPSLVRFAPILLVALTLARPAGAVMDIEDRGPVLNAGRFALRVSNIGVLGNPWFDVGRSFDPSFEYPRGSGQELLGHAELWVGARPAEGEPRVSGGPMYEWRPTLAPTDRVRRFDAGVSGSRWNFDDDGDGRIDEDPPNGRDDDGDGKVDEDFDLPAQQMLTAEYTDTQPEAVSYGYPQGEPHVPLGLAVHQEALAWSSPGSAGVAGLRFVITNIGAFTLHEVRLGVYADLDSRLASDRGGHINDRLARQRYQLVLPKPDVVLSAGGLWTKHCFDRIDGEVVTVWDGLASSGLPAGGIVGITHTTDPLGRLDNFAFAGVREALAQARAPVTDTTFHSYVYAQDLTPQQGGPPTLDRDRWAALRGEWRGAPENEKHDYAVLITCGPFSRLEPGQSVEFSVALLAAATPDSIASAAVQARLLARGTAYNYQGDTNSNGWLFGDTGINGHEICLEPPPGVVFDYDPHCPQKFFHDEELVPKDDSVIGPGASFQIHYSHGHCVWTDLDCDACTGSDGSDTWHRWSVASPLAPAPGLRVTAGDHSAVVEWNDAPEVALQARLVGDAGYSFAGYKVYRLDDWTRASLLPAPERWQRIAVFRPDTALGGRPLASITDSSLAPGSLLEGRPVHPIGRYRFVDPDVLDGFDYHYVVTSFLRAHAPHDTTLLLNVEQEGPFMPEFANRVTPHAAARAGPPHAWVVPNPYRGRAEWERPAVPGDVFTRHIDFLGLPRENCVIRIYTVAGDLVASVDHSGSNGDGQASWNLISRNGQDVASGVYLFTVDAPSGHQVGKFVIMR
jgi:hypothetical protein